MVTPIQALLEKITFSEEYQWKWHLLKNWNIIVGDLSQRIRLERIQDETTLIIGVYNSAWIQELYFLSHIIIKTINQQLDIPRIKTLRFKYSPIAKVEKKTTSKTYPLAVTVQLNNDEKSALIKIRDPELQQSLEDFLIRCHRERAWPT